MDMLEHNPALSLMNKLGAQDTQDVNNNFSEAKLDELVRVADLFIRQYGERWTASYNHLGVVFYPDSCTRGNIGFIINVGIRSENESPGSYIDVFPRFGLTMYGNAVTAFVDDASDKMWERIANGRTLCLDDMLSGVQLEQRVDELTARLVREIPWPTGIVSEEFVRVPEGEEPYENLLTHLLEGL